jgi:hypothetical protein
MSYIDVVVAPPANRPGGNAGGGSTPKHAVALGAFAGSSARELADGEELARRYFLQSSSRATPPMMSGSASLALPQLI